MIDTNAQGCRFASSAVYLEYGADEGSCEDAAVEISPCGMRLALRWDFAPGTQLSITLSVTDRFGMAKKIRTMAVVVEREQTKARSFLTTLLFPDPPRELWQLLATQRPTSRACGNLS